MAWGVGSRSCNSHAKPEWHGCCICNCRAKLIHLFGMIVAYAIVMPNQNGTDVAIAIVMPNLANKMPHFIAKWNASFYSIMWK